MSRANMSTKTRDQAMLLDNHLTTLRFSDWTQIFGEERLTAALLDRFTHHTHILESIGESYRFKHRKDTSSREDPPITIEGVPFSIITKSLSTPRWSPFRLTLYVLR